MAAAFDRAGFDAVDVHMSDIIAGACSLADFKGFAACGGFSYGDVLGAGEGWAKSILFNPRARDEFEAFFQRADTFALGVCNGCQMMSNLRDLIPGAQHWPHFVRNRSEQFEARFVMVEVTPSPSLFFAGMAGSRMPIAIAHGEGYAEFGSQEQLEAVALVGRCASSTTAASLPTTYPFNPNGSPQGITGLTTPDGRFTIVMPHPERVFRTVQNSWHPAEWGEDGPWMRMFRNARQVGGEPVTGRRYTRHESRAVRRLVTQLNRSCASFSASIALSRFCAISCWLMRSFTWSNGGNCTSRMSSTMMM